MNYKLSFPFSAVILADGDYPTHPLALRLLDEATYVCCCDGAGKAFIEKGRMPDAIVGDGDSLTEEFKEKYQAILHLESEQDDNDLTKATRFCISKGFRDILYLGTTGKREDHTLANLSLMVRYLEEFDICPTLMTDHGYFTAVIGSHSFDSFEKQQVSIFNFTCTVLSGIGLRWEPYPYRTWWQGTLNEALGDSFKIEADGAYLVFRTFDTKD